MAGCLMEVLIGSNKRTLLMCKSFLTDKQTLESLENVDDDDEDDDDDDVDGDVDDEEEYAV